MPETPSPPPIEDHSVGLLADEVREAEEAVVLTDDAPDTGNYPRGTFRSTIAGMITVIVMIAATYVVPGLDWARPWTTADPVPFWNLIGREFLGEGEEAAAADAETRKLAELARAEVDTADSGADVEPFVDSVLAAVRAADMVARVSIQSFDWRTLQVVQREAPEIATVYLTARQRWLDNVAGDPSPWTAGFRLAEHGSVPKLIHAAGGRLWSSYFGDLDAAQVQEAKALGISVLAWTVNAPADIVRMLDLGVDGLISDRPDLVRAEMARRGMALPPATPVVP